MEPASIDLKNDEEDRISDLPESVIHHIFSFVEDTKQVVQTCVLSKRWRYVWTDVPFLSFCDSDRDKSERKFEVLVNKVLLLHESCSNINSFSLLCRWHDYDTYNYAWILKVLRHNVKELYLDLLHKSIGEFRCELPYSLYSSKTLTVFEFNWHSPGHIKLNLPDSMCLPSLKTLVLRKLQFQGDDVLYKICSSCPVLESLSLIYCKFGQTNRNIYTPKLQHLEIINSIIVVPYFISNWIGCSFKLYAPNLISFLIEDSITTDYCFENLSALVKAEIDMVIEHKLDEKGAKQVMKFLMTLHNVEDLKLSNNFLKVFSRARPLVESKLIQFLNLKCLKLYSGLSKDCLNAIIHLLKISPNIESLFLHVYEFYERSLKYPYWDEVTANSAESGQFYQEAGVMSKCMLHHLRLVKIRGNNLGRLNHFILLEFLLKNAPVLKNVVLENVVPRASKDQSVHLESRVMEFTEHLRSLPEAPSCIKFFSTSS